MKNKAPGCNPQSILAKANKFQICIALCLLMTGCATLFTMPIRPLPKNVMTPVVAVSSFENRSGFSGQWNLGSGMAALLVAELVRSKNFVILERRHLNRIFSELERQKDKRFRDEGKLEHGRLKNTHYLIRGVINDFSQVGGGFLNVAIRRVLFIGKGCKARVSLTLTIVDVETGVIIDSVQTAGTAHAREVYLDAKYKNVAFGGTRFFKTPLGIATSCAIRKGIRDIIKKVPRVLWQPMIAAVFANKRIIINGGSNHGLKEQSVYVVKDKGQYVTDPVTGDFLDIIPGPVVGAIQVTEVKQNISYAKIIAGSDFKRGQKLCLHLSR